MQYQLKTAVYNSAYTALLSHKYGKEGLYFEEGELIDKYLDATELIRKSRGFTDYQWFVLWEKAVMEVRTIQ
ncbi:hypothetical protein AVU12_gp041 [Pseudomonas phage KPP21]|uniref:Uncharacterized protein n=1 Tax=Pseudomonas phage KPP21 TaxID=1678082 RepID=A0A0H5B0Z7_BPK21|nr:hypothetical protein AVU12_gp041 [Pseudomonas phage KPP21]BAR94600.1 hypothetical protein [Pseudomonas phage KPP21]